MLGGAAAVLITGQISIEEAFFAINFDVILFLFGMCVAGEALQRSGYIESLAHRLFSKTESGKTLIFLVIMLMGFFSAVLMNDTVAIIGTPLVLSFAARYRLSPSILLLALCMAVTTGSVMSPIGNPQNLLIANYSGLNNPFLVFFLGLGVPTLISLGLVFVVLILFYRQEITVSRRLNIPDEPVRNPELARLARISLAIIFLLIAIRILAGVGLVPFSLPLMVIALGAAAPILLFSSERMIILKNFDWPILVFFISLFILMQSVFLCGFFQSILTPQHAMPVSVILALGVIISQFISNVPFVALFQPLILNDAMSIPAILALSAGSTIAGNLTIIGAASNVIVVQNAENKGYSLSFWEFFRIGLPLTILQSIVYILFLGYVQPL
jgi:Na+/H+ antiporter NhaD/arsenite permease-like protein